MTLLIEGVMLNGKKASIQIEGSTFSEINPKNPDRSDQIIDGRGEAAIPSLINNHTHAAMSLLRGYADDFPLHEWLTEYIWPREKKLKAKDVYWGARLACLEMLKTGTTCFNDMYFFSQETAKAARDSGLRAVVSEVLFDPLNPGKEERSFAALKKSIKEIKKMGNLVKAAIGPHAVYTLSEESLAKEAEFSRKEKLLVHFHLSETEKEVKECIERHGKRPVEFLDGIGFFSSRVLNAHCVWLDAKEIEILARRGARAVHCPVSNQKLAVGRTMPLLELQKSGVLVSLGTDGCASNNSLDLLEEMKFASLAQKFSRSDPTALNAEQAFSLCTKNAAQSIGLNAGAIEKGKLADLCLVDLKNAKLVPGHSLVSDLVYSATGDCIDAVICNGRVVMESRKVEGEEEVVEQAKKQAFDLVQR